jgi:hypothetical protein
MRISTRKQNDLLEELETLMASDHDI